MTRKCVIPHCGHIASTLRGSNACKYLCFPTDPERRRKWIQAAGVEDLVSLPPKVLNKNRFICSCHFEAHLFKTPTKRTKKFPTIFDPRVKPLSDDLMLELENEKIQKIETTPVRVPLIGPLSDDLNESLSAVTLDKLVKTRKLSSVRLSIPAIASPPEKLVRLSKKKIPAVSLESPCEIEDIIDADISLHEDHPYLRRELNRISEVPKIAKKKLSVSSQLCLNNEEASISLENSFQVQNEKPEMTTLTNTMEKNSLQQSTDFNEENDSCDTPDEYTTFGRIVSMKLGLMNPENARAAKSEINLILNARLAS